MAAKKTHKFVVALVDEKRADILYLKVDPTGALHDDEWIGSPDKASHWSKIEAEKELAQKRREQVEEETDCKLEIMDYDE